MTQTELNLDQSMPSQPVELNIKKKHIPVQINDRCTKCSHNKNCCRVSTTIIYPNPNLNSDKIDVFIIDQGAGKDEDININPSNRNREPFVGRTGRYMRQIIKWMWNKNNLFNLAISNTVRCHPINEFGKDRAPTTEEEARCIDYLYNDIIEVKPKCILTVGKSAATAFFPILVEDTMKSIRGITRTTNIGEYQYNIVSTYHPSYLCRQYGSFNPSNNNIFDNNFISDLNLALTNNYY